MENQICKLLVVESDKLYSFFLQNVINQIHELTLKLAWVTTQMDFWEAATNGEYDVYLLGSLTDLDNNLQLISFLNKINPGSVVLLTNSPQVGQVALQAGATDYLKRDQLNPHLLEHCLRSIIANVHTRRQLSARLIEQEQLLQSIFEQVAIGVVVVKPLGKFLKVSRKFCNLVNYSTSELLRKTFLEITHLDDLPWDWKYLDQVLQGNLSSYRVEKRLICKHGHFKWVNFLVSAIFDGNNQPQYMVIIVDDIQKRKQIEHQLSESKWQYQMVSELVSDYAYAGKIFPNRELRIEWITDAVSRITGFSKTQITKYQWQKIIYPQDLDIFTSALFNLCQGQIQSLEYRIVTQSGEIRWLRDSSYPLTMAGNQEDISPSQLPVMVYGAATDITKEKQAEEKLRASETLYASIFNHSADSIFLVNVQADAQFTYAAVNPAYEHAAGKTKTELMGKQPHQVFPPQIANHFTERYFACLAAGEVINYEETLPLRRGSQTWRTVLVPIRDATGRIVQLQGSSRDITIQKKAQIQQLRHSQYQNLLSSLTLKIRESLEIESILHTTVTEVQYSFQADRVIFVRLLPDHSGQVVSEAVVTGLPKMQDLIIATKTTHQEYWQKYQQGQIYTCTDVRATHFKAWHQQFLQKYQIRSSLIVPILVNRLPMGKQSIGEQHSRNDTLWGLLCLHQCQEPRKWLNCEIEFLQQLASQLSIALYQAQLLEQEIHHRQALARSNAELEQFAYIASHDLQEPLVTVNSYAKLLQKRYQNQLDGKADRFIHHIVEGSQRMQTMIRDLLAYSRLGRSDSTFELTDCNQALLVVIANLQHNIEQEQAQISYDTLPTIVADPLELVQLFQNLLSNALKYRSNQPPLVHISVSHQDNGWCFVVQDNGIGIKPEYRDRIFQVFQRLHTQSEYPGNGIGLAICQRIVEHHGGRIWVDSELGKGATFYFTLSEL